MPFILKLLAAGADREARDEQECTPLNLACCCSPVKMGALRCLLAEGAKVEAVDYVGRTALLNAVLRNDREAVRLLLPVSDLARFDEQGRHSLHNSVAIGSLEMMQLLLAHQPDCLNTRSVAGTRPDGTPEKEYGHTALTVACHIGRHAMVTTMLRMGALRNIAGSTGFTPLITSTSQNHLSCVVALLGGQRAGFAMSPDEVSVAPARGWTALHSAAHWGHPRICGVLIQAGARLDVVTEKGFTPMMIAQRYHPTDVSLHTLLSGDWVGPLPGTFCEHCHAVPDSALMHCSGCLTLPYCCPRCAAADWPRHAPFCKERRVAMESIVEHKN